RSRYSRLPATPPDSPPDVPPGARTAGAAGAPAPAPPTTRPAAKTSSFEQPGRALPLCGACVLRLHRATAQAPHEDEHPHGEEQEWAAPQHQSSRLEGRPVQHEVAVAL